MTPQKPAEKDSGRTVNKKTAIATTVSALVFLFIFAGVWYLDLEVVRRA